MDPLTALLVAVLFADLVTGGWVHSTLIGGATGAARETWADLSPRIPTKVKRSRAVRAGRAVGVGALYGGAAVVRGVRTGVVPGVQAGHSRWKSQRHYWHRARDVWARFRLWRERRASRPVGGAPNAPTGSGPGHPSPPGGGPGGGRGVTPGPRTPGTTATPAATPGTTTGGTTPGSEPDREQEPLPVAVGDGTATGTGSGRPTLRVIPGGGGTTGSGEWTGPRTTWGKADSLADLTHLTEGWLRGDVREQPGYYGPVDVDEDDAPGITAALIAANRAGYLTHNSQAGYDGQGRGRSARSHFRQLAWVTGRARPDVAERLADAARAAGFNAQFLDKASPPLPVTWVDGKPFTVDRYQSAAEFGRVNYPGVGRGARTELVAARPLAITDPVPGRNTLWPWLERTCNALTTDTTSTTDSSTPTSQEDTTVSTATVDVTAPNTHTEDVPAHIDAGENLAKSIEDVAEQFTSALEDAVRAHIQSAEQIPGFPPSLQGAWEDGVASPLSMVTELLKQAAEGARGAAVAEADALRQSVEAADQAPADSDLSQSRLRTN